MGIQVFKCAKGIQVTLLENFVSQYFLFLKENAFKNLMLNLKPLGKSEQIINKEFLAKKGGQLEFFNLSSSWQNFANAFFGDYYSSDLKSA
jgi:hypothetical protein